MMLMFKRLRWLWFAIALYGLLTTPSALLGARGTHLPLFVVILALTIRFATIFWLMNLWWKYRPSNQQPD